LHVFQIKNKKEECNNSLHISHLKKKEKEKSNKKKKERRNKKKKKKSHLKILHHLM
jgi:hypothetical protein